MLWGIIGAMDDEIALLVEKAAIEETRSVYGLPFYRGRLEGQAVVLVCCGIGKVNAAICACALIEQFRVDKIVHVGIAGALGPHLGCLDVVVATEALYHDIEPGVLVDYFPHCDCFPCDPDLVRLAEAACSAVTAPQKRQTVRGRLISGDQFINSRAQKEALRQRFDAACVEMEGAATAHVAFVHRVPFLILRIISDSLRDDSILEYYQFKPLACEQSSQMIGSLLRAAGS